MALSDYRPPLIVADAISMPPDRRGVDLARIIQTYNGVADKLQESHEALGADVVRLPRELASIDVQLQRSRCLAALGEMAAGIADEIRNLLVAMQLYAQMLVDDLCPAADSVGKSNRCPTRHLVLIPLASAPTSGQGKSLGVNSRVGRLRHLQIGRCGLVPSLCREFRQPGPELGRWGWPTWSKPIGLMQPILSLLRQLRP